MATLMNERKYRAALIGVFAVVLLCGALMFMKYGKEQKIPAEGTLVKNESFYEGNDDKDCKYAGDMAA